MPKKHQSKSSGGFDKFKSVKFRLVYRDPDDPNAQGKEDDRVFQIIETVDQKHNKDYQKMKKKLLAQFSDKDLGKYDPVEAKSMKNTVRYLDNNLTDMLQHKQPVEDENVLGQIKGRDDLWINHLQKNKDLHKQQKEEIKKGMFYGFQGRKDIWKTSDQTKRLQDQLNNQAGEDEEYEVEELEGDEDEWEDDDDEESEQQSYEEYEDEELMEAFEEHNKKKQINQNQLSTSTPVLTLKDKLLDLNEPLGADKFEISKEIKMKLYDENGFPLDGYNYYQHIADEKKVGQADVVLTANYEKAPALVPDIDYKLEEMNDEQKEVYDALMYQVEDNAYEELEDDFVLLASEQQELIKEKKSLNIQKAKEDSGSIITKSNLLEKQQVKDEDIDKVMEEYNDSTKNSEQLQKITQKDFSKILDEHMQDMKQREKVKLSEKNKNSSEPQNETVSKVSKVEKKEEIENVPIIRNKQPKKWVPRGQERKNQQKKLRQPTIEDGAHQAKKSTKKQNDEDEEWEDETDSEEEFDDEDDEEFDEDDDEEFDEDDDESIDSYDQKHQLDLDEEEIQKFVAKDGQEYELHGKQFHARVDPSEDLALKAYIDREQLELEGKIQVNENYERSERNTDIETVTTKSLNSSVLTRQLNIVKEGNKKKDEKKDEKQDEKKVNEEEEHDSEEEEDDQDKSKIIQEVFKKRNKNETKEEKKERKEQIKQFKQNRKNQKKEFIQKFEQQKNKKKIIDSKQAQTNLQGLSVYKL